MAREFSFLSRQRYRALAVLASTFLVFTSVAVVTTDAASFKPYYISAVSSGVSGIPGTGAQTPGAVTLGLNVPSSSNQQLGSLQITVPAGYQIFADSTGGSPVAGSNNTKIVFQNLNIQPTGSGQIALHVTAPCGTAPMTWTFSAQQANQWQSGNNANYLTLTDAQYTDGTWANTGTASGPNTTSKLTNGVQTTYTYFGANGCVLKFNGNPSVANAAAADATTGTPGTKYLSQTAPASGTPVQVGIYNALTGAPVSVSGVDIHVDLTGGTGSLAGTVDATTNNSGVASFADLTVSTVGANYQLIGSAPGTGLDATTSTTFEVFPTITLCTGTKCNVTFSPDASTNTNINAPKSTSSDYFGAGSNPYGLTVSCNFAPFFYADAYDPDQTWVYFSGTSGKTVTLTIYKSYVQSITNNGLSYYHICLAAPYQFNTGVNTGTGTGGTGAVLIQPNDPPFGSATPVSGYDVTDPRSAANNATDFFHAPWYVGTLAPCANVGNVAPCITSTSGANGNRSLTFTLPAGDPIYR